MDCGLFILNLGYQGELKERHRIPHELTRRSQESHNEHLLGCLGRLALIVSFSKFPRIWNRLDGILLSWHSVCYAVVISSKHRPGVRKALALRDLGINHSARPFHLLKSVVSVLDKVRFSHFR